MLQSLQSRHLLTVSASSACAYVADVGYWSGSWDHQLDEYCASIARVSVTWPFASAVYLCLRTEENAATVCFATRTLPPTCICRIDVMNGIAYNHKDGLLYVTGKFWPSLFAIKVHWWDSESGSRMFASWTEKACGVHVHHLTTGVCTGVRLIRKCRFFLPVEEDDDGRKLNCLTSSMT